MKFRAAAATVAAVPLALGLAGCGNDTPEATGYKSNIPVVTTTATPQKAVPAPHLNRVTFVPAMNAALTKQKSWRISGTVTANHTTVATISGMQSAKPAAVSMEMSGPAFNGRTVRIVGVGKAMYLSLPGRTPAGKYVKVAAADLTESKGGVGSALNSANPTKTYQAIARAMQNVKYVRSQTIDGRKLDRYDLTVDTATVAKLGGAKTVPQGLPKTLTYSLWMDSAHVVRRMDFNQLGIVMVINITDYNKPVHITAPPASKIVR